MSYKGNRQENKKIADITLAVSGGLAALMFAANLAPVKPNGYLALLFLVVGLGAIAFAWWRWSRL